MVSNINGYKAPQVVAAQSNPNAQQNANAVSPDNLSMVPPELQRLQNEFARRKTETGDTAGAITQRRPALSKTQISNLQRDGKAGAAKKPGFFKKLLNKGLSLARVIPGPIGIAAGAASSLMNGGGLKGALASGVGGMIPGSSFLSQGLRLLG